MQEQHTKRLEGLIIAVDYDGTIVDGSYPDVGTFKAGALETLKRLNGEGATLILWTCREGAPLTAAVEYLTSNGVVFSSVNTNGVEDFRPTPGRKVFAHIYIDDRIIGGFPGWDQLKHFFFG